MDITKFDFRYAPEDTSGQKRMFMQLFEVEGTGTLPIFALLGENPRWIEWGSCDPNAEAIATGIKVKIDQDLDLVLTGPMSVREVMTKLMLRHWHGDFNRCEV